MDENKQTEPSLEEVFRELDEIIAKMEQGDLPLDEAFAMYESGLKKLKICNEKLDLIEKKMMALNNNGEVVEF